jgi:hypothetical protein
MQAPTAVELLSHAVVQLELELAWVDSLPGNPVLRHEEGGWIYMNVTTGVLTARRATNGGQAFIDLNNPPVLDGCLIVAKFHTHPNPTAEGWEGGPSETDLRTDAFHGVPDLIRADNGVYVSGPDCREGGLVGNPGYPR